MTIEEVDKRIGELDDKVHELWEESFNRKDGWEWYKSRPELKELISLERERKLMIEEKDIEYSPIPSYGDHMTMEDFVECCKFGVFVDSDGFGNYATKDKEANIPINPSDVMAGKYRTDFTHVVWYNK